MKATTDLRNVRGAVAMARGSDPHTAKTEFFINVKDNPQLDTNEDVWGYCVFGHVIEGMDVVDRIRQVPVRDRGTRESVPVDAIVIDTAYVAVDESEWAHAEGDSTGGTSVTLAVLPSCGSHSSFAADPQAHKMTFFDSPRATRFAIVGCLDFVSAGAIDTYDV